MEGHHEICVGRWRDLQAGDLVVRPAHPRPEIVLVLESDGERGSTTIWVIQSVAIFVDRIFEVRSELDLTVGTRVWRLE